MDTTTSQETQVEKYSEGKKKTKMSSDPNQPSGAFPIENSDTSATASSCENIATNSELSPQNPKQKRKYNFQRASVACEQCRKAKTRCNYINNGASCFRCENLSLKCSLIDTNLEPTLSTFQKSTTIISRDSSESSSRNKRRRRTGSENDSSDPKLNSEHSHGLLNHNNSPSHFVADQHQAMLSIINEKIDSLGEAIKELSNEKNFLAQQYQHQHPHPHQHQHQHQHQFQLQKQLQQQPIRTDQPQSKLPLLRSQQSFPSAPLTPIFPTSFIPSNVPSISSINFNAPLARPYLYPSNKLLPSNNNSNTNNNVNGTVSTPALNNQFKSTTHENDEFFFLNAPYIDLLTLSQSTGLPFSKEIGFDITKDLVLVSIQERYDLIKRELLDYNTCYRLIEVALVHYGKWITYYEVDYKAWFDRVRSQSPLLFCTLVLFGLRHQQIENVNNNLELDILQSIHQLLSLSIYEVPQSKEFLQAVILLTHFAPSLSYKHIYFDSWWVSSYGLIHFMTREMTMNLLVKSIKSPEKIHQYRIWNHLTISHIINCILSGRPCVIDEIRLDQCRDILDLPEANAFDAVIVGELCITLSLYNSLQFPEDIETSLKDLSTVYSDWKYLTQTVSLGSVITGYYYFAKLMILRRYILKNLNLKGQEQFSKYCRDFFNCALEFSTLISTGFQMLDISDLLRQCCFLNYSMLLQFKQLNLFNESNDDYLILQTVENFSKVLQMAKTKARCYNGYYDHYGEFLTRLKNITFSQPPQKGTQYSQHPPPSSKPREPSNSEQQ